MSSSNYLTKQLEFVSDLVDLIEDQAKWSQATFGSDEERGPAGPLLHLKEEVDEILKDPRNVEEWADAFLLYLDAMRRAKFNLHTVVRAASAKMLINKSKRTWPITQGDDGKPVHHNKDEPLSDEEREARALAAFHEFQISEKDESSGADQ